MSLCHVITGPHCLNTICFKVLNAGHYCLTVRYIKPTILNLFCCATNRKFAGSIPDGVLGIFHWHKILPIALWPWGWLSLYQKWVPGTFPGSKGGRCVRLATLPSSCAVVLKSGSLNFLEPSGTVQTCNGPASPSQSLLAHGTLKKVTELTQEPLPVHNKSNIKSNTSIFYIFYEHYI